MILLDSSILIELFRKKDKEKTLFYGLSQSYSDLCISSITYYEIGVGNRNFHAEYWESLSDNLNVIPFDKACSNSAVTILSLFEIRLANSKFGLPYRIRDNLTFSPSLVL
jgi:tRNA(fMet)-specific endonuclease VapC